MNQNRGHGWHHERIRARSHGQFFKFANRRANPETHGPFEDLLTFKKQIDFNHETSRNHLSLRESL